MAILLTINIISDSKVRVKSTDFYPYPVAVLFEHLFVNLDQILDISGAVF